MKLFAAVLILEVDSCDRTVTLKMHFIDFWPYFSPQANMQSSENGFVAHQLTTSSFLAFIKRATTLKGEGNPLKSVGRLPSATASMLS